MKFNATALCVLLSTTTVYGQFSINTPTSLIFGQPAALNWSGGTAPYSLSILPGGQISAPPIENLGEVDGTTFDWVVNVAAGTSVTIEVTDATGARSFSQQVTIQN